MLAASVVYFIFFPNTRVLISP